MANLNKCLLIGHLTKDPELRYTTRGTAVAEINLAINRATTDSEGQKHEETTYVDGVTLWGRQAEVAAEYLKKGRPVFIEGRLSLDSWDDKQTGEKRSKLKVTAERMQLLGAPREPTAAPSAPRPFVRDPQPRPAAAPAPPRPAPVEHAAIKAFKGFQEPDLDVEIPF